MTTAISLLHNSIHETFHFRSGCLVLEATLVLDCDVATCNAATVESTVNSSITTINGKNVDIIKASGEFIIIQLKDLYKQLFTC